MAEEKKKPSSLRGRIERSRKVYVRKKSPAPIIVGAVVLLVMGIGLYVGLGKATPRWRPREEGTGASETTSTATSSPAPGPASVSGEPRNLIELVFYAREDAKTDPDAALQKLRAGLAKWGDYPDIHHAMAMTVDRKMARNRGNPAVLKQLAQEKLGHLEKAMELIQSGKNWNEDTLKSKTENLKQSIEQARKDAGR